MSENINRPACSTAKELLTHLPWKYTSKGEKYWGEVYDALGRLSRGKTGDPGAHMGLGMDDLRQRIADIIASAMNFKVTKEKGRYWDSVIQNLRASDFFTSEYVNNRPTVSFR